MATYDLISTKMVVYNNGRRQPTTSSSSSSRIKLLPVFYFILLSVVMFLVGSRYLLLQRPSSISVHNDDAKNSKSTTSIKEEITASLTATKSAASSNDTTTSSITTTTIPPLNHLLDNKGKVIADISWMLDFAIIGFPKSGTSFLKNYLNSTEETYVYHVEFCIKKSTDLTRFVEIYHDLHQTIAAQQQQQQQQQRRILFGLKCPGVLYRSYDLHIYKTYFPTTKFIIGLRHPVLWFESFYNYQMNRNVSLPSSTSSLIGGCQHHQKVCTDRGRFHAALARLRKTPMVDGREVDLLFGTRYNEDETTSSNYINNSNSSSSSSNNNSSSFHQSRQQERFLSSSQTYNQQQQEEEDYGFPNQLLLYEVRQLHQNDTSIRQEVSNTLRNYLNIQQTLPPILSYKNVKPRAIDICDDVHASVRKLLVNHGMDASIWIKEYLWKKKKNPSVVVADPVSFVRLLDSWSVDPCRA